LCACLTTARHFLCSARWFLLGWLKQVRAVPPERPVFPLPVLNTVVAGITGIAAGAYYALLMGYLSRLKKARIQRELDWAPFLDGQFIDYARSQAPNVRKASGE